MEAGETRGGYWIGFDLGGTKMLATVFDDTLRPVGRSRKRTKCHAGETTGLQRLTRTIHGALDDAGVSAGDLRGIGVGCPGPLDLDRGVILEMPNLHWRNVRIKETLEEAFGCPVVILNDVDSGVYAEYRFGSARDARCVVGVFPGTGIGGGAVYEGRIMRGRTGSCMEIGHIPVQPDGPLCGCGRRGCLEAVASRLAISAHAAAAVYRGQAPHLQEMAGTDLINIRSGALAKAIADGDTVIEDIVRKAARDIGWVMAGVVNLLCPDVVVLGGGLVEEMPGLFLEEVDAATRKRVMPSFESSFRVVTSELGDTAGVLGAAAWAKTCLDG